MGKGLKRSLSGAGNNQKLVKLHIEIKDLAMVVNGAAGIGRGNVEIGGFPEGNILFLGAVADFKFSGPGADAGLVDTWAGDYSIGSSPDANSVLDGDEVNIIPSTALAAATAEVSPKVKATNATAVMIDNTTGNFEPNLNLIIDDVDISASGINFTVDGSLDILFVRLGDD